MLRSLFSLVFICAFSLSPCFAAPDAEAKEREAFYQWFASLKYPAAEKLPLARLRLSAYSSDGSRPDSFLATDYAFLLKKNKDSIEIFHPNLFTRQLSLAPKWETSYKIIPFAQGAKEWLEAQTSADKPKRISAYRYFDGDCTGEAAAMSYYFHRAGLEEYAVQAFRLWKDSAKPQNPNKSLTTHFARVKFHEEESRIIEDLHGSAWASPSFASWESILQRCKNVVQRYGRYADSYEIIRDYIPQMEKLARQEREHDKTQRKSLAQMSQSEKIKELIYQLRDQDGAQIMSHGHVNIYGPYFSLDYDSEGRTPAHQLRKIGLPALPYLAEAIDDDRLTRTLGNRLGIWRVSQVVSDLIFDMTAGEPFQLDLPKNLPPAEYKRRKQAAIAEWLQKVEKTCSTEGLCERVRKGDSRAAELLLERNNAKALLEPLKYGILHAKNETEKNYMFQLCPKLPRAEMVPFLTERATTEKTLDARVAAIRALGDFEKEKALEYMIRERRLSSEDNNSMTYVLLNSGVPEALRAVETQLHAYDARRLDRVLSEIASSARQGDVVRDRSPQSAAYRKIAEEILARYLKNTTKLDLGGSFGDFRFSNPRLCDLVAIYLNSIDKKRYPVRYPLPVEELDKQCLRLINIWRKENGLPPLADGR